MADKRALMATSSIVMQRVCADILLEEMCNKVEINDGECLVLYEKHRGDETPFARVNAHDRFDKDAEPPPGCDNPAEEVPVIDNPLLDQPSAVAVPSQQQEQVSIEAHTVTANLKVYQCDCEISALLLLKDHELLISFKLTQPLTRLNRCTADNYRWLHKRQSNLLNARRRFKRVQRLHTSDGDKAQDKCERALETDLAKRSPYPVPTFRSRCQVHRVYHCITLGLRLFASFLTGQIRLALSLRGPGHFTSFKTLLYNWLLQNNKYEKTDETRGIVADAHRENVWRIYFPRVKGKRQRKKNN